MNDGKAKEEASVLAGFPASPEIKTKKLKKKKSKENQIKSNC